MRVCVFGSSSKTTKKLYVDESYKLGQLLAEGKYVCVTGGGLYGCMGGVTEGAVKHGGVVKGVIHKKFCVDDAEHPHIKDMDVVEGADLWERKQKLMDNGDCILVLPGGTGTFDELWEAVSGKSLGMKGLNHKPICLVNIDGFYDGFVQQMNRAHDDGVLYGDVDLYFHVENTVESALKWCALMVAKAASGAAMDYDLTSRIVARNRQSLSFPEADWFPYLSTFLPLAIGVAAGFALSIGLKKYR